MKYILKILCDMKEGNKSNKGEYNLNENEINEEINPMGINVEKEEIHEQTNVISQNRTEIDKKINPIPEDSNDNLYYMIVMKDQMRFYKYEEVNDISGIKDVILMKEYINSGRTKVYEYFYKGNKLGHEMLQDKMESIFKNMMKCTRDKQSLYWEDLRILIITDAGINISITLKEYEEGILEENKDRILIENNGSYSRVSIATQKPQLSNNNEIEIISSSFNRGRQNGLRRGYYKTNYRPQFRQQNQFFRRQWNY